MKTLIETIKHDYYLIKEKITLFFNDYVSIKYSPSPPELIGFSDYYWDKLNSDGIKLQKDIFVKFKYLTEIIEVLLTDVPDEYLYRFDDSKNNVLSLIELNTQVWEESTKEVCKFVVKELENQFKLLEDLFSCTSNLYIFVPDTNALLINPELEKWAFDCEKFEILLMPTVLSELDHLKLFGRNEIVRNNANKIIKQLKEYRRRGRLIDGVVIRKDKSIIKTFAIEPDFNRTLPWLNKDNNDDRLLASFIEVLRKHPNDYVNLVTADINLQNKAEFANLPFVEVPELK